MPIYEYQCPEHGTVIVRTGRVSEDQPDAVTDTACRPAEKGPCLYKRILSTFSGHFGDTPRRHT